MEERKNFARINSLRQQSQRQRHKNFQEEEEENNNIKSIKTMERHCEAYSKFVQSNLLNHNSPHKKQQRKVISMKIILF